MKFGVLRWRFVVDDIAADTGLAASLIVVKLTVVLFAVVDNAELVMPFPRSNIIGKNNLGYWTTQTGYGPPWSGAGVGVGMLNGAGIPLLENKKVCKIHQISTMFFDR